jgi:LysM repeat protein
VVEHNKLDQAEELRRKMIKHSSSKPEIDFLKLPPRSSTHASSDKKVKLKFRFPIIKLLAIFFIIVLLSIVAYSFYPRTNNEIDNKNSNNIEEIIIEESSSNKNLQKEVETVKPANKDINKEDNGDSDVNITPQPVIPTKVELPKPKVETDNIEYEIVSHKVSSKDTLYSISKKYFGNSKGIKSIMKWNGLKSEVIKEGQILNIPLPVRNSK